MDATSTPSAAYFQQWQDTVRDRLRVPTLDDTFVSSLTSIDAIDASRQQAIKARNDMNKNPDATPDQKQAAQALVDSLDQAVAAAVETTQASAVVVLDEFTQGFTADHALWMILQHGGAPRWAEWCNESEQSATRVMEFLCHNPSLQQRVLVQGIGARQGCYGPALQLYQDLVSHSASSMDPVLDRLALAVALELCADDYVIFDTKRPLQAKQRYTHFEQAYLLGELDPSFPLLDVWEMRLVVNCDANLEELGWGRQAVKDYRPDFVLRNDKWRYCFLVKSDVGYRTPNWTSSPRTYDQILDGGGKCGPRAWYGRFACKVFGIPTWGIRQPGHAAMTRWTQDEGWVTCLGAGFEVSWWEDQCGNDFLLETQARKAAGEPSNYLRKVVWLEIMATLLGEPANKVRRQGIPSAACPWWSLAMMQRQILLDNPVLDGDYTGPTPSPQSPRNQITALQELKSVKEVILRQVDKVIIPAAAFDGSKGATTMKSFMGGHQVYLNQFLSFTMDPKQLIPDQENYTVKVLLATAHRDEEPLVLTVASSTDETTYQIEAPYTRALWETTKPISISVPKNATVKLKLARTSTKFGIAIKHIILEAI